MLSGLLVCDSSTGMGINNRLVGISQYGLLILLDPIESITLNGGHRTRSAVTFCRNGGSDFIFQDESASDICGKPASGRRNHMVLYL